MAEATITLVLALVAVGLLLLQSLRPRPIRVRRESTPEERLEALRPPREDEHR